MEQTSRIQPITRIEHLEHILSDVIKVPVDKLREIAEELIKKANEKKSEPVSAPVSHPVLLPYVSQPISEPVSQPSVSSGNVS